MKRYAVLIAIGFILIAPAAAWSQSGPDGGGNGNGGGGFHGPGAGAQEDQSKFQHHKEEILQRISEHISEMQKRQSCVQAANDRQALMACMPQGGEHGDWGQHGSGGFHHGGRMQSGAPTGGESSGGEQGGGEPNTQ